jgi:hypothetical protein
VTLLTEEWLPPNLGSERDRGRLKQAALAEISFA